MWGKERQQEDHGVPETERLHDDHENDQLVSTEDEPPRQLVLLGQAQQALAAATSLDEIKDIRDKAEAARKYVESARLGLQMQNHAAEIKLRAERRAGQLLARLKLAGGDRKTEAAEQELTLEELGLTKHQSSRWQREATVPEDVFERFLQEANESALELTSQALLRLAREFTPSKNSGADEDLAEPDSEQVFQSLDQVRGSGLRFTCIYADPPLLDGEVESDAFGRHALSIEQLCELPVADVVEEQAHLHLWLGSDYLPSAERIMKAWGFEYRSSFVWIKPQGPIGGYWRLAHDFLLLGVRGELAFRERRALSWLRANRITHGRKPEKVRRVIQKVSPGPCLELFARKPVKGWAVCGDGLYEQQ